MPRHITTLRVIADRIFLFSQILCDFSHSPKAHLQAIAKEFAFEVKAFEEAHERTGLPVVALAKTGGQGKGGYGPHRTGRNIYGKTPALMVEIHLTYDDGTTAIIGTDETWKQNTGPELEADFLMGETYDAHHDSPHGRIAIQWKRQYDDSLLYEATIPPNTTAALTLPAASPWKNENPATETRTLQPGKHRIIVR